MVPPQSVVDVATVAALFDALRLRHEIQTALEGLNHVIVVACRLPGFLVIAPSNRNRLPPHSPRGRLDRLGWLNFQTFTNQY